MEVGSALMTRVESKGLMDAGEGGEEEGTRCRESSGVLGRWKRGGEEACITCFIILYRNVR